MPHAGRDLLTNPFVSSPRSSHFLNAALDLNPSGATRTDPVMVRPPICIAPDIWLSKHQLTGFRAAADQQTTPTLTEPHTMPSIMKHVPPIRLFSTTS